MTALERLQKVQERFDARGARLVHVTWGNVTGLTRDQLATDLAVMLEAYLDGKCTRAVAFDRPGDHVWGHRPGCPYLSAAGGMGQCTCSSLQREVDRG